MECKWKLSFGCVLGGREVAKKGVMTLVGSGSDFRPRLLAETGLI